MIPTSTYLCRWAAALVLTGSGCAGGIEDPDQFPPPSCFIRDFDVQRDLFDPTCATADCHSVGAQAGGLNLDADGLLDRLVDVPSACGAGLLIDSSSTSASLLLDKVRLQGLPRCGQPMPLGAMPISDSERACLTDWVNSIAGSNQ